MKISGIIWLVSTSLGFGLTGWLCVFRTETVVIWGREGYERRKMWEKNKLFRTFFRTDPISKIVLKPWYRTYIRWMGIFIWLWALMVLYLVVFHHFR